jgi:tetratricopeptide (TPR) repeat protein
MKLIYPRGAPDNLPREIGSDRSRGEPRCNSPLASMCSTLIGAGCDRGDGMVEEIITALSRVRWLLVIASMMTLVDRALSLHPSFARGWYVGACLRHWAGQPELAIERAEASWRLSPRAQVGFCFTIIGAAHFLRRRFDKAIATLRLAIQEDPDYPPPYRFLASCYAHMGRLDEAREIVRRLRPITPLVAQSFSQIRNADHRALILSGLHLASADVE